MMDSDGETRDLLPQQIKEEFECDIVYEPIKREIVEEDSSEIELDHDESDSEDDVFYETIEPAPGKKIELKNICKSEKDSVKNKIKLVEEEPCKSREFTDAKDYNLSCTGKNILTKPKLMSELSGLEGDMKNALENPSYEVDCDQKEGVLIMKMINKKFSLKNEDSSSHSKNSLRDKVDCKNEAEDDIEIVYEDTTWEDSSENKATIFSEVCNKSFGNETDLNKHKSDTTGCGGQNKVNLDSTDDVMQGGISSEEKISSSSAETTKESAVIKRNLSTSKDGIKMLKVHLHRNFGFKYPNHNNGDGSFMYDLPPQFKNLQLKTSRKEQRPFQCELCSKSFSKRSSMLRHYRIHREEKPQCAVCSKSFHSKEYLLCHIRIIHKGDLLFQCKFCLKSFTKGYGLSRHERIHKRINPYHCKVCTKSFFNKTVFTIHEKSHERKLFNCNLCSNSFRNSSNLDKHLRDHNKNKKSFRCTFCQKSFSGRYLLATHERIHKGEKPFRCNYCPKAFADKAHLPVHERTHSGERPFLCKVCSKSFTQSAHLRIHEKIHIGEKPFSCKICSKSFLYNRALFLHQRVHKSKKERFRDDKYHCKFCSKSFQGKTDLDRHENTHSAEKPYQCKSCSRSYSAKGTLAAHERDRHRMKTIKSKV